MYACFNQILPRSHKALELQCITHLPGHGHVGAAASQVGRSPTAYPSIARHGVTLDYLGRQTAHAPGRCKQGGDNLTLSCLLV